MPVPQTITLDWTSSVSSHLTNSPPQASFAGQHDTFLNVIGGDKVVEAVLKCWASVFNDRAVEYRGGIGVRHDAAHMAVVVQTMVDPRAAGTAFSIEIGSSFPGLHIAAAYGLGEGVVSGEVTSDEWLFEKETLTLIKRVRGSKNTEFVSVPPMGIEQRAVSMERQREFCLDTETARSVARGVASVSTYYKEHFGYDYIDTEFAVDKSGRLFFLQARPVVPMAPRELATVDSKTVGPGDVVMRGKYALPGAVHGTVKVVEDFTDLASGKIKIGAEDIVVAVKTSNYWNQYLHELKAIVTVEGSPTSHPMLIGRERKIPVVIGCADAMSLLAPHSGTTCTLDGLTKCVYKGAKPLIAASPESLAAAMLPVVADPMDDDDKVLTLLKSMDRTAQDELGNWYVFEPNYPVSPLFRDWHVAACKTGLDMLQRVHRMAADADTALLTKLPDAENVSKEVGDKLGYRFANAAYTNVFAAWGPSQFDEWNQLWQTAADELAAATQSAHAADRKASLSFSEISSALEKMFAFKWLQIFARNAASHRVVRFP